MYEVYIYMFGGTHMCAIAKTNFILTDTHPYPYICVCMYYIIHEYITTKRTISVNHSTSNSFYCYYIITMGAKKK